MSNRDENTAFGMKVFAGLFLLLFIVGFWTLMKQENSRSLVEDQLKAISEKRLTEAYYAYTSKDFQESSSLETFKKFISFFPPFSEKYRLTIEKTDNPAQVKAILNAPDEKMQLLYTLSREGDLWKVRGIEVVDEEVQSKDLPEFDASIFQKPIQGHLEALKQGDKAQAYKDFTTQEFQNSTPLKVFTDFIDSYPVFSHYAHVNYQKLTFNNNIGTYSLLLEDEKGERYNAKYDLVKEKGKWKIIQIDITDNPKI